LNRDSREHFGQRSNRLEIRIPSKVFGSICIAEGKVVPHAGHTRVRSGRVVVSIPSLSACCRRAAYLERVKSS
jgi:hypothetical protein